MSEKFALIIEDEADLATIFSEALRAGGFETEIIQDGAKAVERLKIVEPVVVAGHKVGGTWLVSVASLMEYWGAPRYRNCQRRK